MASPRRRAALQSPCSATCISTARGIGLGVGDEFRNGLGGNRRVDLHDIGYPNDACDRRDVVDEIEVELEHRRVDGICRHGAHQ